MKIAKESKSSVSIPAFHKMLVLAQWALGIFNEVSFENIFAALKHPSLEGIDENDGHTKFHHAIVNTLFYMGDGAKCTKDELAAYDLRIVGYWKQITLFETLLHGYMERFYKALQSFYKDKLIINSVILSDTPWTDPLIQTHAKGEWEAKNVLFLEDGGTSYLHKLFVAAKAE